MLGEMASKSSKKKTKTSQGKKEDNPWTYQQNLTVLLETDKLSIDELLTYPVGISIVSSLCCSKLLRIEMMNCIGYLVTWWAKQWTS